MKITVSYPSVDVHIETQDGVCALRTHAENIDVYIDFEALALAGASIGQLIAQQLEAQLRPKS